MLRRTPGDVGVCGDGDWEARVWSGRGELGGVREGSRVRYWQEREKALLLTVERTCLGAGCV